MRRTEHIAALRTRMTAGIDAVIEQHQLPWHVTTAGAKGCITFLAEPTRNLRDFLTVDDRYGHAHWLVQHNGGVFLPPWGKIEQWLISVQHTNEDVDRLRQRTSATLADRLVNARTKGDAMTGLGQLSIKNLVKRFDEAVAVDRLSLDIGAGEFFSLLGASGCGKNGHAAHGGGFERPDEGRILLDGVDLVESPRRSGPSTPRSSRTHSSRS